jgi:hypothetical protein
VYKERMARARWLVALTLALLLAGAADADASEAPIITVAGGGLGSVSTTAVPGLSVQLSRPAGLVPGLGGLLLADPGLVRILKIDGSGNISVIAGTGATPSGGDSDATCPCPPGSGTQRAAVDAKFGSSAAPQVSPQGVTPLIGGGYLIADTLGTTVRYVDSNGYIYRWAGTGVAGCGGDNVAPTLSALTTPVALAQGSDGNVLIADQGCLKIREVLSGGNMVTIAGNGDSTGGPPNDSGGASATTGNIGPPLDVSVAQQAGLYYFSAANRIWELNPNGYRLVGDGTAGFSADGTDGRSAKVSLPSGIAALAPVNTLVYYEAGNARIRRVLSDGKIATIAGNGTVGLSADGTPASQASLDDFGRVAVTPEGLFFTQRDQSLVRMIPATAISSSPPAITRSTTASFGLASWDDAATYACKSDADVSFAPCHDLTDLGEGPHTFYAKATTTASGSTACCTTTNADPTPATFTWTVDSKAPDDFALVAPANNAQAQALRPLFSWNAATDPAPGTGIDHYELFIGDTKTADIDPASCTGGACSYQPPVALSEAAHDWHVVAVDKAGNGKPSETRRFSSAVPPIASYVIGPTHTLSGKTVNFDASASSDEGSGIAKYEWDLDGDGTFETDTGTKPTTSHVYTTAGVITTHLRVTDGIGLSSTAAGDVTITASSTATGPLGVSINDGAQYTNDPHVTVFAVWPSFDTQMVISNDGGFKQAQTFAVAARTPWVLDSSGPERLPKTIYVRFTNGTITSETFQDDIILDQTPPQVVTAALAPPAGATGVRAAAAAKKKFATLKIKATDNVSGVGTMQVTPSKRKPGKLLRYKRSLRVKPAKVLFVRVRDRAGNFSRWRKVAARR